MSLSKRILKNVLISFLGRIYTAIITFVVVAVLLPRTLSEEGFGIYAFYSTIFGVLSVIVDFGANVIAVREGSREPGRLGAILYSLTFLRLVMSVICLAVSIAITLFFEREWESRLLLMAASVHILFHALGGFGVVFHLRMKFSFVVFATAIGHTCFFAVALVLFLVDHSVPEHYLLAFGAGLAVSNVVSFLLGKRLVEEPIRGASGETARLFKEAFPLGISAVLAILYFNVDTLLLRPLQGEEAVGLYSVSYRLLTFAILFPVFFNQVLLPVYSRLATTDAFGFRRVLSRCVFYMGAASVPTAVALVILAEPVLRLIYPPSYARSADCLRILGIAVAVIFLTYPHVSALITRGFQRTYTWIAVIGLLLNVVLNLLWIPRYSIEGAAFATVVTEGFVLVAVVICVKTRLEIWIVSRDMFRILPVTLVVGAGAWALQNVSILIVLPALGLLFVGSLYLFGLLPFDIGDDHRD